MTATTSPNPIDLTGCEPCVSRRVALAGVAGAAAVALTGCATYGTSSDAQTTSAAAPAPDPAAPAPAPASDGAAPASPAAGGGAALASVADVPVGGGLVLADAGVVLTQPTEGTILAFSAICTHAGCAVNAVADGTINCPCHGSKFSVTDGSVVDGPAGGPLEAKQVTVSGDSITLA